MTAEKLLERTEADAAGRLRWLVMERLGICPASLRGRLMGRRFALRVACQIALDGKGKDASLSLGGNPNFDMARFERMARS